MQVKKIMTKNPACCTADSTLQEVAHMMEMYDCGCIPVVEDHKTMKPVGTITDRDITIRTVAVEKNPIEMTASDIMTTDITTVTPDTKVQECLNVMAREQIRRVLVVDKTGRVTGIVAQADLAEHASHPAQTAHFIREVSESDNERDEEENTRTSFDNRQTQTAFRSENRNTSQREFLQNRSEFKGAKTEKSSFFNTTTLLTLLGSIGLGAGVKYFMESGKVNKHRPFTGTAIKTHPVEAPDISTQTKTGTTMKTDQTDAGFTTGTSRATATSDTDRTKVTGSVDSFEMTRESYDTTRDRPFTKSDNSFGTLNESTSNDDDSKPILELGRTASKN